MCDCREAFEESLGHMIGPRQSTGVPTVCAFAAAAGSQCGVLSSSACIRVESRDEPVDRVAQGNEDMASLGGLMAEQRMGVHRGLNVFACWKDGGSSICTSNAPCQTASHRDASLRSAWSESVRNKCVEVPPGTSSAAGDGRIEDIRVSEDIEPELRSSAVL
eukprot:scaffold47449_cov110-Phaeocystis_antarctica.AAC.9